LAVVDGAVASDGKVGLLHSRNGIGVLKGFISEVELGYVLQVSGWQMGFLRWDVGRCKPGNFTWPLASYVHYCVINYVWNVRHICCRTPQLTAPLHATLLMISVLHALHKGSMILMQCSTRPSSCCVHQNKATKAE